MVIDAGSLESLDQLYCEARHWLDNYGNKVKLVLLLAIQRDYQKFLLERWQMHEGQPVRVQEFKIAPADCDCGAVDVRPDGMDLVILSTFCSTKCQSMLRLTRLAFLPVESIALVNSTIMPLKCNLSCCEN